MEAIGPPPLLDVLTRALQESQCETAKLRLQLQESETLLYVLRESSGYANLQSRVAALETREAELDERERQVDIRLESVKKESSENAEERRAVQEGADAIAKERDDAMEDTEANRMAAETALYELLREHEELKKSFTQEKEALETEVVASRSRPDVAESTAALRAEIEIRKAETEAAQRELVETEGERAKLATENAELGKDNIALRIKLAAAAKDTADRTAQAAVLRSQLLATENSISLQQTRAAELGSERDTLRDECAKVQRAAAAARAEGDILRSRFDVAERRAAAHKEVCLNLEEVVKQRTAEVDRLQQRILTLEAELNACLVKTHREPARVEPLFLESPTEDDPYAPELPPDLIALSRRASLEHPPIAFFPEDDIYVKSEPTSSNELDFDADPPRRRRSQSPPRASTSKVQLKPKSARNDAARRLAPHAERQKYLEHMAPFVRPSSRSHFKDLRPVSLAHGALSMLSQAESKTSLPCLFLRHRTVWCTPDRLHALGFVPTQRLVDEQWVPDDTLSRLAERDQRAHLFVQDGREATSPVHYAGIYAVHDMRAVHPPGSILPSDILFTGVMAAMNLRVRRRGSEGYEVLHDKLRELYPDGRPRTECFGLQCVGLDEELYRWLLSLNWAGTSPMLVASSWRPGGEEGEEDEFGRRSRTKNSRRQERSDSESSEEERERKRKTARKAERSWRSRSR
ncbi:hypothetical protein MKEN_00194400 [Mycena kentingensis (nom. inval.)]|nr:hypothetical protein MKEN_00194400 [Mycena kentingensis (nom. inval.)]